MQENKTKVLYRCDPIKNKQCKKTSCAYNKEAKYHFCKLTTDRRYARLDDKGEPIESNDSDDEVDNDDDDGFYLYPWG